MLSLPQFSKINPAQEYSCYRETVKVDGGLVSPLLRLTRILSNSVYIVLLLLLLGTVAYKVPSILSNISI